MINQIGEQLGGRVPTAWPTITRTPQAGQRDLASWCDERGMVNVHLTGIEQRLVNQLVEVGDRLALRLWFSSLLAGVDGTPAENWPARNDLDALLDAFWNFDDEQLEEAIVQMETSGPSIDPDNRIYDSRPRILITELLLEGRDVYSSMVVRLVEEATRDLTPPGSEAPLDLSSGLGVFAELREREAAESEWRHGGPEATAVVEIACELLAHVPDDVVIDDRARIDEAVQEIRNACNRSD